MFQALFGQAEPARRSESGDPRPWSWLADPRSAVLLVLASVVLIGGGRRLYLAAQARRSARRLGEPDVTPEEIVDAARHGREGLIDLFRLLSEGPSPEVRRAAGQALAILWRHDDLIPEEEQAVLRRSYSVHWRARRKYPRGLQRPIPIAVSYGVPFLDDGQDEGRPRGVEAEQIEWSHRIAGSGRASLEGYSAWKPGQGQAEFTVEPSDFPTEGPHRLVLQSRARAGQGLTSEWEVELPHMPFQFEFDPHLTVEALLTLPDEGKKAAIERAVRLAPVGPRGEVPRFLDLPGDFVLQDPPELAVSTPLPSDLAHSIELEFEGVPGRFPAGSAVVSGQGTRVEPPPETRSFPIGPIQGLPLDAIERPGEVRLRAVLQALPELGWADPDVRSIWPEPIVTDWTTARVIRR